MKGITGPTELSDFGKYGIILDVKPHLLPPEAWSGGNNVVFTENGVERARGHDQVFGSLFGVEVEQTPEFVMNVPGIGASFWLYFSLAKAFVVEGGVHTDITRISGDYNTVAGRQYTGTIFGGIAIVNNGIDQPQAWLDMNPATPLIDLPDFTGPSSSVLLARVIRTVGQYLVALNVTEDGVPGPHTVLWSHKADPGTLPNSWDYSDPTKDAGRVFLTDAKGGQLLDGLMLGDELFMYKERSTHALRFVGGDDIFAPRQVLATTGIMATRCVCAFDNGTKHFLATGDDIIIHAGSKETKSVAENRVKNTIYGEMDPTNYVNAFVFENRVTKECWFCYPTLGNTYPNKAARWNYVRDVWTFRDFDGVSVDYGTISDAAPETWDTSSGAWDSDTEQWSKEGRVQQVFVNRALAYQLETGYAFGGETPLAYIERLGISIDGKTRTGEPRASLTSRKLLSRTWPKIVASALVDYQAGKQELLEGSVTWDVVQQFDAETQRFLDSSAEPVNGVLLAQRYQTQHNFAWTLQGHDLYVERLGGL